MSHKSRGALIGSLILWNREPVSGSAVYFVASTSPGFVAFEEAWHEEFLRKSRQFDSAPFPVVFDLCGVIRINDARPRGAAESNR